ncbi:MAG: restriction endonuclease subunit S [Chromatiales bacterium]
MSPVPEEAPQKLPADWHWTTMGEIADVVGGGTPRTNDPTNYEGGDIPWVTPADLSGYAEKYISHGARFITRKGHESSSARLLPAGAVLFTSRAPIGYVAIARNPVATNQGFKSFVLNDGVLPEYVYWWLKGSKQRAEALASGTTFLELSGANAKKIPIPIAPLEQQRQIVAEIEKQFSRLDEAVANLKRVKAHLKQYQAAVLKAAVEGRLVPTEAELARRLLARGAQASEGRSLPTSRPGVYFVYAIKCHDDSIYVGHTDNLARRWEEHLAGQAADWTRQHKPIQIVHYEEYSSRQEASDREKWLKTGYGRKWIKREIEAGRARQVGYETGAQLLQRILETRRQQWLTRADKAGGKGKGKYKEPAAPDTTDLPELPEGWAWASYEQVGRLQLGRQRAPKYHSGPNVRPYLRVQNVFEDRIDLSDVMEMDFPPHDFEKYQLAPGDLLLNEGQSPELLGRPAVYRGELPGACFTNTLIRFRAVEGLSVEFALLVSRHNMHAGRFVDEGTITTNIAHLSVGRLAAVEFPLPPSAEQHRIVTELDRRFSLVREVEAQVEANLKRAERLRQSILERAFSGRLVREPDQVPSEINVA